MFLPLNSRAVRRATRRTASDLRKAMRSSGAVTRAVLKMSRVATDHSAATIAELAGIARPRLSGRFVEVGGLPVHYIVRGRGRPVVLLHGNGTMAEDFVICGLVERLSVRYRVIAIDRPGFGHTPRPRLGVWTASAQARLVERVLERLNVERPVLVGHSWGTLVALSLAAQARCDLRGLVLLSGYYFAGRQAGHALAAPLALPGIGDAARALVPEAMSEALARGAFRHVFSPQAVPARFRSRFPTEIALGREQLRAAAEDTATLDAVALLLRRQYGRLRLPVTIMAGDADAVVDTVAHSRRLHAEIGGSVLTVLPGKGHMMHYSAQREIALAVDRLMDLARGSATRGWPAKG